MEEKELSEKELQDQIAWITFIIPEFAEAYKKNKREAFIYLDNYGGFDYVYKHWRPLHCENPENVIHDMFDICKKNGGNW